MYQDDRVRYSTAVQRLRTIAESCTRAIRLSPDDPVLCAAYVFGDLLDVPDELPVVQVAFVIDLPVDELTWGIRPASVASIPYLLEIEKAPVDWYWRPVAWPVGNHTIRRPLRIWSTEGVDQAALDALARRQPEPLRVPDPDPTRFAEQLRTELAAGLRHLHRVRDGYWDRDWRAAHGGAGFVPENYLWDAVHGYLDLLAAVESLPG